MELTDLIKQKVKTIISEWGDDVIKQMRTILESRQKIASGDLLASLHKEIYNDFNIRILMADHGRYVDSGRKPGKMPPKDAIERWMLLRAIPPEFSYPIRKHIADYGIKSTNFTKPFYDMQDELQEKLLEAVGWDIMKYIQKELETIDDEKK